MSYQEARELAQIRMELRERLLARHLDGADALLARLRAIADARAACGDGAELHREHTRWQARLAVVAA